MSQNKIKRLALRFKERDPNADGDMFFRYLLKQNPDLARVTVYNDPTGEKAVNRVMRMKGRR
jgi:hypothetical protein